ncbi:hypothetical protein [Streptomyces sp. NPDC002088]|uniref:hypothetical protein n=1 Tax=Streptomyces sp. NPDC002088 TaxID=3154665 RepID=UPI003331915D
MNTIQGYKVAQVGKGKAAHYSTGNDETVCGRMITRYLSLGEAADMAGFCSRCDRYVDTHGDYQGWDEENDRRYLSITHPRPARPSDGTYSPAEAGARGWRDASPLWLDGRHVTAGVEGDGTRLYVFLGTEMIFEGDMPEGITGDGDVNPWVRQYAIGYVWAAEYRTLWSYRDHAGRVWGPYADAEFRHTDGSAENYCRAIVDTTGAGEVIRTDRRPEVFETTGRNWTDTLTVVHVAGAPREGEEDAPAHGLDIVTTEELRALLEPATAPVTVWVTTESGERINYAHVPNGDPARVAQFLDAARAVPHFRDVSTTC